jgi:hypothetical protein
VHEREFLAEQIVRALAPEGAVGGPDHRYQERNPRSDMKSSFQGISGEVCGKHVPGRISS